MRPMSLPPEFGSVFTAPPAVATALLACCLLLAAPLTAEEGETTSPPPAESPPGDVPPPDDAEPPPAEASLTVADVVSDQRMDEPTRADLSDEEQEQFAQSMRTALAAEEAGDYEEARTYFVEAYTVFPHSNLLLATARTSHRVGDDPHALEGYQSFLARRPDYENRDHLENLIADLEAPEVEELPEDAPPPAAARPSLIGWSGVGLAALGTVAMIGGARTASGVDSDFAVLDEYRTTGDRQAYESLADDMDSRQSRGKLFFYGGMGLVTVGAAAIVYDLVLSEPAPGGAAPDHQARLLIGPTDDGGVSVSWHRRF